MTPGTDRIIVLDRGIVSESGTHHELLSLPGGLYASMWSQQQEQQQAQIS